MRLPVLKAASATALAILPLLVPALGSLALTPGLTTAALAGCSTGSVGDPRLQIGCGNPAIMNTQTNPCAGAMTGDPRLQRGKCNVARMPVKGRDAGPQPMPFVGHNNGPKRMPSLEDASRVPINRGGL